MNLLRIVGLIASMWIPLALHAQVPTEPQRYGIKQSDPSTGTHVLRQQATGPLPFDKSYAQLTAPQKAQFNSQYEQLGPLDEPPFPENGLGAIYGPVSQAQQKLLVVGHLAMDVYVDASGAATKVDIVSSPSPEMTKFAAAVAMATKFKPALCNAAPCAMGFPLRIDLLKQH